MVMLQGGDCTSLRFRGKTAPRCHPLHRYAEKGEERGKTHYPTHPTHPSTDRKKMPAALVTTTTAKRGRRGNTREGGRRGRPKKTHFPSPPPPPVSRRSSLRTPRRQHREDFYNVDEIVVDDEDDEYFEQEREQVEEEVEEEEEDFRSKKKLKLLLKLHQIPTTTPTKPKAKRGRARSGSSPFSSSDEDAAADDNGDSANVDETGSRHFDSSPRSYASVKETPLPDSKTLILILDKIQKKDKYGVFRDPVDLDELPDYHEIIEHPMDFSTIRNKLARNLYSNLEQFESDIFLLCSNAMQYNTPETIYFKQANSMQELARKRFQTIRAGGKCSETILNAKVTNHSKIIFEKKIEDQPNSPAEKSMETQPDTVFNKPMETQPDTVFNEPMEKKSMCSSSPKAQARSEIDSIELKNAETVSPSKSDNHSGLMASSSVVREALPRKADEPSGLSEKMILSNNGQKSTSLDEDRRATYITSNQQQPPPSHPDYSLFADLESDKTLVAVGLLDESSYARSLARFSASLGPIAWRIASGKIEKAIPAGMKFGPGWVGEYEPLMPLFSCENYVQKLSSNIESSSSSSSSSRRLQRSCEDLRIVNNGRQPLFGFALGNQPRIESDRFFHHQKDKITENSADFHTKEKTKSDVSSNVRAMNNFHSDIASQQSYISDQTGARANSFRMPHKENQGSLDVDSRNRGVVKSYSCNKNTDIIAKARGMGDGQDGTSSNDQKANGSSGFGLVPFGTINQKVDDPAKLIRMLPGNVPNYPNSYYSNTKQFMSAVVPPPRNKYSSSPLATTCTHASWMPATARSSNAHETSKSLGNSEVQMRTHLPSSTNKPTWMFPQSMPGFQEVDSRRGVVPQLVPNISTVSFPQIISNELSRLHQGQTTTWQGGGLLSHAQQKQSKNMVAPDLNFGFQSPGSPGQQSSGILVESQQPDLALQL